MAVSLRPSLAFPVSASASTASRAGMTTTPSAVGGYGLPHLVVPAEACSSSGLHWPTHQRSLPPPLKTSGSAAWNRYAEIRSYPEVSSRWKNVSLQNDGLTVGSQAPISHSTVTAQSQHRPG